MQEIWKDVKGYEGRYQVSNLGRVKSLNYLQKGKEQILKATKIKGYLVVNLYKEGKAKIYTIHRLVAKTFIENPDNLPQVNHKDECKTNNIVDNLEWCSAKYNNNYGSRTQRCVDSNTNNPKFSKKVLCVETGVIYPSIMQVQRDLGFLHQHISYACSGKLKTAYGFHWKYID